MLEHVSDLVYQTLLKEGYSGQRNDAMKQWLRFESATGEALPDLWKSFFALKLIGGESRMDQLKSWLITEGHAQDSVTDAWASYWLARNALP